MKLSRLLIAAAAVALLGAPSVFAQGLEIKVGHVGEPGSLFDVSANEFSKRANAKLGAKAKVAVFGSSQLGGDKEQMQKLLLGTLELAVPSTVMTSVVDQFGVFEMPYLVKDREHMKRIEKEVVWPKLAPLAAAKGYTLLAVWENGSRHITNNVRPIVMPEDLKGIKLRVPEGKWRVKMFQTYGANPSAMKFSEVFTALKTGTMDGQENPFSQIYSAKFHEAQKYLSITDHVYTPAYVIAGTKRWEALPADVRKILADTAKETQGYVYETAARMEKELLDKIKAAGVAVNNANKDAFVKASAAIYKEFGDGVPGAGEMIATANKLR